MSKYYNGKRTKNIFDPGSEKPFKLSRSKIDLFLNCPKCFYIDRRLGVSQPPSFPFNLNSAVDTLLKKEFDFYRARNTKHPLMESYGLDVVPFANDNMDKWRNALYGGVEYLHVPTNLLITGAVDDIWINDKKELHVVDYKATSKNEEVNIDAEWQIGYKRQMEIYQWLLRKNNFRVSSLGYFVYCNGDTDKKAFDGKLEFDVKIIPYNGSNEWIEKTVFDIQRCLVGNNIPESGDDCDYCKYRKAVSEVEYIKL